MKYKPEDTFQIEFTDGMLALCTVLGYNLWDKDARDVMIHILTDKGESYKNLVDEGVLEEMQKRGSKLNQMLK